MEESKERIPVITIAGQTGVGKSFLCNQLGAFKEMKFKEGDSVVSETSYSQRESCSLGGNPKTPVIIVDNPGLADNRSGLDLTLTQLNQMLNGYSDGIDVILFCLEPKDRPDKHSLRELSNYLQLYSDEVEKKIFLVITKMSTLQPERAKKIESRYMDDAFWQLLNNNKIKITDRSRLLFATDDIESSIIGKILPVIEGKKPYYPKKIEIPKDGSILDCMDDQRIQNFFSVLKADLEMELSIEEDPFKRRLIKEQIFLYVFMMNRRKDSSLQELLSQIKNFIEKDMDVQQEMTIFGDLYTYFSESDRNVKFTLANDIYQLLIEYNSADQTIRYSQAKFMMKLPEYLQKNIPNQIQKTLSLLFETRLKKMFENENQKNSGKFTDTVNVLAASIRDGNYFNWMSILRAAFKLFIITLLLFPFGPFNPTARLLLWSREETIISTWKGMLPKIKDHKFSYNALIGCLTCYFKAIHKLDMSKTIHA